MQEYTLKKFEGFHETINEVIEAQVINLLLIKNDSIPDAIELVTAYNFNFSSAFLLILSLAMMIGTTTNLCSKKFVQIKPLK